MASDETKARITEVAGPIFAEKGFRDATVREICDAASVGLASVNYHFRDKQHLYIHVVETAFDDLDRNLPPLRAWPAGTPAEARLREFVERLASRVVKSPRDSWQECLVTREIHEPTPGCEDVLRRRVDTEMAPLLAVLADVLPPEVESADCRQLALSIVGQILLYHSHRDLVRLLMIGQSEAEVFEPDRITERVLRVTLAALGLRPPLARRQAEDRA